MFLTRVPSPHWASYRRRTYIDWYWTEESARRLDLSYMSVYLLLLLLNYFFIPIRRKRRQKREDMVLFFWNKQKNPNPKFLVTITCFLNDGANYAFELKTQQYVKWRYLLIMWMHFCWYSLTIEGFKLLAKVLLRYQSLHLYFEYL